MIYGTRDLFIIHNAEHGNCVANSTLISLKEVQMAC